MDEPKAPQGKSSDNLKEIGADEPLRVYVRLDFQGSRQKQFLRRAKPCEMIADELRQAQALHYKSFPMQGVTVEEIDTSEDVYFFDRDREGEIACAPLSMVLQVRTLECLLPFILRPECTRVEVLSPAALSLSAKELERFLYGIFQSYEREVSRAKETFK